MHRRGRRVHRDLLVVDAQPVAVGVRVGEQPRQQHPVRARPDARHHVARRRRELLHLGVVVDRVAVQGEPPHLDQRVVRVRPHLGQVERVEPVAGRVIERHDLHVHGPAGVLAARDRLEQIPGVVVVVGPDQLGRLGVGEELDALVGLEVVLHPEPLARLVDPHVGVARVPVHVPPALRQAAVAHQPDHLVRGLRQQGPEVPLHVVGAQVVVDAAFLRADEVLEVNRVLDEEDRRGVADHVVVALGGVELQREPAQVPPQVGAAALPRHGGEPGAQRGRRVRLEQRRLGVGGHVLGDLEPAERAAALGVRLPLRDPLPVPLGHLLDQVAVLQQDRAARAHGQRVLIAFNRNARIRRLRGQLLVSHTQKLTPGLVGRHHPFVVISARFRTSSASRSACLSISPARRARRSCETAARRASSPAGPSPR